MLHRHQRKDRLYVSQIIMVFSGNSKIKSWMHIIAFIIIASLLFPSVPVKAETNIMVSYYKTVDSVNVRSGPGQNYEVIGTLDGDIPVTVFQNSSGWGKIYYEAGEGWVYLENLSCLDIAGSDSISDSADDNAGNADAADSSDTDSGNSDSLNSSADTDTGNTGSSDSSASLDSSTSSGVSVESAYDTSQDTMTFSGPGWNLIQGVWRYGDSDGLQVYASNTLYQAWKAISDRASNTGFYIVVDCTENEFYIFYGAKDCWVPIKLWQCSTGRWDSPTKKGDFTVLDKGYSFGEPKYSCYYYTEFTEGYLFHSILYDAGTFDIQDDRLGENVSNGCVRLALENAKWIYDNIPVGTAVYIY